MLPSRMAAEGEIWLLLYGLFTKGMSRVKGSRVRMAEWRWRCEYWAKAMS